MKYGIKSCKKLFNYKYDTLIFSEVSRESLLYNIKTIKNIEIISKIPVQIRIPEYLI